MKLLTVINHTMTVYIRYTGCKRASSYKLTH